MEGFWSYHMKITQRPKDNYSTALNRAIETNRLKFHFATTQHISTTSAKSPALTTSGSEPATTELTRKFFLFPSFSLPQILIATLRRIWSIMPDNIPVLCSQEPRKDWRTYPSTRISLLSCCKIRRGRRRTSRSWPALISYESSNKSKRFQYYWFNNQFFNILLT